MTCKLLASLLLFASLVSAASISTAQPITLKLGRKIKITDQYLLTTTAKYSVRIAVDAPRGTKTDSTYTDSVRLQALCDVASVTEVGEEYEKKLTIRYFQRFVNNATIDVLPTGAIVKATFGGPQTTFLVNGTKPKAEVEELLRLAVRSEGGTKTGDILDPSQPVALGETWSVNREAFARTMATSNARPSIKGIKGLVRFVSIDSLNGKPCATVVSTVQQTFGSGTEKSPAVESSYDMTISVPIDVRYPPAASKVRAHVRMNTRGKGLTMTRETIVVVDSRFER